MEYWDRHKLKRAWQQRQPPAAARKLGEGLQEFLRQQLFPRRKKLAALGAAWRALLPPELVEHSCLEDLRGGKLRVLVDTAAHLHELNLLVREGLTEQLRQAAPGAGLATIKLARGIWYRQGEDGTQSAAYEPKRPSARRGQPEETD